jgi:N-acetylneuraminate synthase
MRWVAEISTNFNGSLIRAARLIDAAAEAGFQAVKTQAWTAETLFRTEALAARPELWLRRKLEMPLEWHEELSKRAHEKGLLYGVTPFYMACVPYLADFVDFFKLSSYQLLDESAIVGVGLYAHPLVISTGMATMKEVQEAITLLRSVKQEYITLLHCVSSYPAPAAEANLACIRTLRKEFNLPVGWSDHTLSPTVVRAAIWRWDAEMVELHWDLDDKKGAEAAHSWTPASFQQVKGWLHDIPSSDLAQFDGDGKKIPARCELAEREWRSDPKDGLRPLIGTL